MPEASMSLDRSLLTIIDKKHTSRTIFWIVIRVFSIAFMATPLKITRQQPKNDYPDDLLWLQ